MSSSGSSEEDVQGYRKGGYHPVAVGEAFKGGKYVVVGKLGWGHFSTVWLVRDTEAGGLYGLKVQKSASHYTEAAYDEIEILQQIAGRDEGAERPVAHLVDHFEHRGPHGKHVCMVFEQLGDNLLTLIKHFRYRGVPLDVVRDLTRCILLGLDFLHRDLQIIHTDLKPENVLLTALLPGRRRRTRKVVRPPPAPAPTLADKLKDGAKLTKNQKKKLRKKLKKQQAAAEREAAERADALAARAEGLALEDGSSSASASCSSQAASPEPAAALDAASAAAPGEAGAGGRAPGGRAEEGTDGEAGEGGTGPAGGAVPRRCKIVDLGNACWTYKQFTSDIQTRQYRSPEVVLGSKYSTSADLWSLACMVFELVTGDLLFDPRSDDEGEYDRDEDHLALMIELLGKMPKRFALGGKRSRQFFDKEANLRHIDKLRFWSLDKVLEEKYGLPTSEAEALASFLLPMLEFVPERRCTAAQALKHPWLNGGFESLSSGTSDLEASFEGGDRAVDEKDYVVL